jgi:cell division protein ZapA (FtsZ GTPase activity inhibitor)
MNEVEVVINGEVYKLISDESAEHIQKVAGLINQKIGESSKKQKSPVINNYLTYMHIILNIADDYIKLQGEYDRLSEELHSCCAKMDLAQSEISLLTQNCNLLENDYLKLKIEFDEFLAAFGPAAIKEAIKEAVI